MTPPPARDLTQYSLSAQPLDPERDLPANHRFAIVVPLEDGDYLVLRRRSNGQTFAMTYRAATWARRGLTAARLRFGEARLYDDCREEERA